MTWIAARFLDVAFNSNAALIFQTKKQFSIMKTVFVSKDVANVWYEQQQNNARNSQGNFYFEGDTIYSYGKHFPIARHVKHNGKSAILFTEREYSNTTSKHKLHVERAIGYNNSNVIHCENVDGWQQHEHNLKAWFNEAEKTVLNFSTCRKPEIYTGDLKTIANKVHAYVDFYELTVDENLVRLVSIRSKDQAKAFAVTKKLQNS